MYVRLSGSIIILVIGNSLSHGGIFEFRPPCLGLSVILEVDRLVNRDAPALPCRGIGLLDDALHLGVGRILRAERTGKAFQFLAADVAVTAAKFAGVKIAFDDLEVQSLDEQYRGAVIIVKHGTFTHVLVADFGPVRKVVAFNGPDAAIVFVERIVFW